jgi:hypothetical protein
LRARKRGAFQVAISGPKVETLREAISINHRCFSFINELFSGENMDYHATIQHSIIDDR